MYDALYSIAIGKLLHAGLNRNLLQALEALKQRTSRVKGKGRNGLGLVKGIQLR
jgi:hypothetical protein